MIHCESCDQPATRKDACGTALCGRCWSADEPVPECDHDWQFVDESFDHAFGTERVHFMQCTKCEATKEAEYDDEPDYDAPRPLTAMENWLTNDEHHVR